MAANGSPNNYYMVWRNCTVTSERCEADAALILPMNQGKQDLLQPIQIALCSPRLNGSPRAVSECFFIYLLNNSIRQMQFSGFIIGLR